MRYPAFLKKNDQIGICAPSAGVGHKLESYEASLQVLKTEGYRILETDHVRLDDPRGGSARERAEDLKRLFEDDDVRMVMAAAGGDFLDEILPYVDFETMAAHPKWLMGASDPTGLLFPYTTLRDVATLYGCNAGSYDLLKDLEETGAEGLLLRQNLAFLKGQVPVQESSDRHLGCPPFLAEEIRFDTPTIWKGTVDSLETSGRCIGGCIDVLKDLIGTPFDGARQFAGRYGEKDGIIWYFDNFALSAEMLYRTFLQMGYAGWFEGTRAILVGRTLFEKSESGMTYDEAVRRAFGDRIPVIWEADIGHTLPHMTLINGAMVTLRYQGGKGNLAFRLD